MKNFVCVFVFVAMFAFSGCATTGDSTSGSAGGSKSALTDADFKKMGITHGGYGNSH